MRSISQKAHYPHRLNERSCEIYLSRKAQNALPIMTSSICPLGFIKKEKEGMKWLVKHYFYETIVYTETLYYIIGKLSDFEWYNRDIRLSERSN